VGLGGGAYFYGGLSAAAALMGGAMLLRRRAAAPKVLQGRARKPEARARGGLKSTNNPLRLQRAQKRK
jgi:hypothetical protein